MALVLETWAGEDPYRSLEGPAEILRADIEHDLVTADFGAVAVAAGVVCGLAFVHAGVATGLLALIVTTLRARGTTELASAVSGANVACAGI